MPNLVFVLIFLYQPCTLPTLRPDFAFIYWQYFVYWMFIFSLTVYIHSVATQTCVNTKEVSFAVVELMPTSLTDFLQTYVNRSFQAIFIPHQRGPSLHWYWCCLRNIAILQMSFYATVLLWDSHFYSTATRILGCPVMAHSRYFYSAAAWTPLQPCNFTDGFISWVLMSFPQLSLFHVPHYVISPYVQYPCSYLQVRAVYRHVVIFQCHCCF